MDEQHDTANFRPFNDILEDLQNDLTHESVEDFNAVFCRRGGVVVMHVNIRSINHNVDLLRVLLNRIEVKPDLIFCSESHVPRYDTSIEGYVMHFNDSCLN